MKKLISVFLVLFLAISFTACSFDSNENKRPIKDNESTSQEPSTSQETNLSDPTIEEQVCFEYNNVKVTAKQIVKDPIWGMGIKFFVENNSSNDYSIGIESLIVNNYMMPDLFYCSVAAGKKANETLYFSSSDLDSAGITNISQIEIYFYLYDSESYKTIYEADCVTIKTSLYGSVDLTPDESGKTLYNDKGIKIIGKYIDENALFGPSVVLYIKNDTQQKINVSSNDLSVNEFMISDFFSSTVYPDKSAIDNIIISKSDLEENDISNIETITLRFHISDSDTYKTIVDTEEITFQAE